jgi:hypothetical protein
MKSAEIMKSNREIARRPRLDLTENGVAVVAVHARRRRRAWFVPTLYAGHLMPPCFLPPLFLHSGIFDDR